MKPFKETRVGKFLASKGFDDVLESAKAIPFVGALDAVKDLVIGSPNYKNLSEADQQKFFELRKLDLDELDKRLADVADSRQMYTGKNGMADFVARRVINWNLPVIALLIGGLVACVICLEDKILLALISSAIGGVTAQLISERQVLINFFFGSSQGSKEKAELLQKNNAQN
ncbi:hypothetical protein BH11BAC1_BH11BAC1_30100 [soil metagenome]